MEVIDIGKISIGDRKRALNTAKVREIAESISQIGLLNPITVSRNNGNYELTAGLHRLEACKALGHETINAVITDLEGLHKELAEIDENLIRNELHYIERGEHLKRRDEILTELGLRAPSHRPTEKGGIIPPLKTTADIAKEIGISESLAHKEKQIATNLAEEVKEKVKALDLPKTEALNLARLKPEEQKEVIQRIETGQAKKVKQAVRQKEIEEIKLQEVTTPEGLYDVVVIDPPWAYGTEYNDDGRRVASPYPEMTIEELRNINLPTTENSVLWLWTTHKFIWDAKDLLTHWGYEYKGILTWDKEKLGIGTWLRFQCEFCLLGIKGKPYWNLTNERDIIREARREHSRKPDAFYEMVRKLCKGRMLDYFSREKRDGFESYGNETGKFLQK